MHNLLTYCLKRAIIVIAKNKKETEKAMIKYVLFDLDGTLLPMNQNKFLSAYFKGMASHVGGLGYSPREITQAIWDGSREMMKNDGSRTNEEIFWEAFVKICGESVLANKPLFDSFYANGFDSIRAVTNPNAHINDVIKELKSLGFTLAIATNPMFPEIATRKRIAWAGLDRCDFEFYTTYEDNVHCKPNLDYYRDVMARLGASADECVMVGNDVSEDMIAEELGMRVFLITDCVINQNNVDISRYPNGNFDDLLKYLKEIK